MNESVLVTGGAGYIGSHVALALLEAGYRVVVVDTLATGVRALVPGAADFVLGDVGDPELMTQVLRTHACSAVLHFAGSTVVPESVADPLKYYRNNTCASRTLLEVCHGAGVDRIVFSSTAAVYGNPEHLPVSEDEPLRPITPYGTSKVMTEWMLRDLAAIGGPRYVALRYFNVAGADAGLRSGQSSPQATHLIKIACEVACGRRAGMTMYGDDYPSRDGTCIRDYIHVSDLADAHLAALRYLEAGGDSVALNCGYGWGLSVREVIAAVEEVAGRRLAVTVGPRRPGDPVEIVAAIDRIRKVLGWTPRYHDLRLIVSSALDWERRIAAR
ncbi:MAG: UDP-glucose 4-epimerase GalE [Alphaproteobacteria bacterium]